MVDDAQWKGLGMLTYDLAKDQIIATYDYAKNKRERPDHVSMSPSGTWITASWDDGVYAFTRDFKTSTRLHHKGEHSDLAIAGNGGRRLRLGRLRKERRSAVHDQPAHRRAHRSVLDVHRPHGDGDPLLRPRLRPSRMGPGVDLRAHRVASCGCNGKVMAVGLKENPASVIELASHHEVYDEYFTEPHASVNRDFTRVVFDSNWDIKTPTDVDTYLIELLEGAPALTRRCSSTTRASSCCRRRCTCSSSSLR